MRTAIHHPRNAEFNKILTISLTESTSIINNCTITANTDIGTIDITIANKTTITTPITISDRVVLLFLSPSPCFPFELERSWGNGDIPLVLRK